MIRMVLEFMMALKKSKKSKRLILNTSKTKHQIKKKETTFSQLIAMRKSLKIIRIKKRRKMRILEGPIEVMWT